MEFSEETYKGFGWKTKLTFDVGNEIFSPETFIDPVGFVLEQREENQRENRERYNEIYLKIHDRYNFDNRWREHYASNNRRDYTPKQKRRISKKIWKYRKRLLGDYE